jgi:hypothetical protein
MDRVPQKPKCSLSAGGIEMKIDITLLSFTPVLPSAIRTSTGGTEVRNHFAWMPGFRRDPPANEDGPVAQIVEVSDVDWRSEGTVRL